VESPAGASATPTSGATAADFPAVNCCAGTDITAATYALPSWLDIPLVLDGPDGWKVINEARAELLMLGRGENELGNPDAMIVFADASEGGDPESIVGGILGVPQLTDASSPSPVVLAGLEGYQGGAKALPNPDYEGDPTADIPPGVQPLPAIERFLAEGFLWTTSSPEAELHVSAVEVGDKVLLVYLEAPPGELDALATDSIPMLETLRPAT
jgi:hypothetical protein